MAVVGSPQGGYVEVICPQCGDERRITERHFRRATAEGSVFKCHRCRKPIARIVVTDEMRDYWLERYSMEWICETAMLIWGPPDRAD